MSEPILLARDLRRSFLSEGQVVEALRGVDLRIEPGESVAIVGRSGAGKSTLLNLIGALDRGYQGELRAFGQELKSLPDRELARFRNRKIGFVFQSFNLLPHLSVGENTMLPAYFGSQLDDRETRRRAHALLADLGLDGRFDHPPMQLSGGERQRIAVARALLLEPPLLVCDEPTGSLDAQTAEEILALIHGLQQRHGTTIVVVTHDPQVAARAGRVITLDQGRVVATPEAA